MATELEDSAFEVVPYLVQWFFSPSNSTVGTNTHQ